MEVLHVHGVPTALTHVTIASQDGMESRGEAGIGRHSKDCVKRKKCIERTVVVQGSVVPSPKIMVAGTMMVMGYRMVKGKARSLWIGFGRSARPIFGQRCR